MKSEGNAGTAFENRVKRLLASGRAAWGIGAVDESEYSAKLAIDCGADFLWIDLEHRPYGVSEVRSLPILCRQKGVAPLVRVPNLDGGVIKKALDIGANTVMVPQVGTVDEAKRAVEYAKYPPQGSRGITPTWTTFMDVSWDDYLPAANEETCVVVQIESPDGIANLDAIAAVDGVDVVFAGHPTCRRRWGSSGSSGTPRCRRFWPSSRSAPALAAKPPASPCRALTPPGRRTIRGTASSISGRSASWARRGLRRRSNRCAPLSARAENRLFFGRYQVKQVV